MTHRKVISTIPLNKSQAGMILAEPVTVANSANKDRVLLYPDTVLTHRLINRLREFSIENITVVFNEAEKEANPQEHWHKKTSKSANKDIPKRYTPLLNEVLKKESISHIQNMFAAVEKDVDGNDNEATAYHVFNDMSNVVNKLVDIISSKPRGLIHISDLKSYDEYTFHHSLSVSVLSMAIGQALGLSNRMLKGLGFCAIMHDIGKIKIHHDIILKPEALTAAEHAIVKRHSELGYQYLKRKQFGNMDLMEGVLSHHEKYDGSGYPHGLKGKQIPLFSRIISVADVYDALTSIRPYRKPINPPSLVIEMIMGDVGRAFDYDVVLALMQKYEMYPKDTFVALSDERIGVVTGYTNPMRPIVKLLQDGIELDLSAMENLNLVIAGHGHDIDFCCESSKTI